MYIMFTALILTTRDAEFVSREIAAKDLREVRGMFDNTRHESVLIIEGTFADTDEALCYATQNWGDGS